MHGAALCLVTAVVGVDVGWQPLPDGGMEYIIQIEPHVLEMVGRGEEIVSDIPPALPGVDGRRISVRVTAGTETLPRVGDLTARPKPPPSPEVPLNKPYESEPVLRDGFASSDPPTPSPEPRAPSPEPPAPDPETPASAPPPEHNASVIPDTLSPPSDVQPISDLGEKAAGFLGQGPSEATAPTTEEDASAEVNPPEEPAATEPAKPWSPSMVTMAGLLCGSFGSTLFIGWVAWDYRRQYRALLARVIEAGEGPVDVDDATADGPASDQPE
jgi:hypothetical protein